MPILLATSALESSTQGGSSNWSQAAAVALLRDIFGNREISEDAVETVGLGEAIEPMLRSREYEVLRMRYLEGKTFKEIGAVYGKTREQARHYFCRGLSRLRQHWVWHRSFRRCVTGWANCFRGPLAARTAFASL